MSSSDGGIYRLGLLPGYGFIFLIIVAIVIVTIVIPGAIIFYVAKVPETSTECDSSATVPGAPRTLSASAEIADSEFDGW
jgi:uncharacterized membrane protein